MDTAMLFLNAINKTEVFLPNETKKLLELFESSEEMWKSNDRNAFRQAEVSEEKIDRFFATRAKIDPEKEWEIIEKESISVLLEPNLRHFSHGRVKNAEGLGNEIAYPEKLLTLPDPPPILYAKGRIPEDTPIIAIVGTRKFSLYGKQVATDLAGELSASGITIVSGLARGIDTFAHTACVERANPTIAVLGSGIDDASLYPPENLTLSKRIIENNGTIISEFSPGAEPYQSHFPQRNRIVSGLSCGVIVIEAPFESGALITAKFALEQGKEVFAVPGPINAKNSEGTNMLIKNGAHPVTSAEDILEVLNLKNSGGEIKMPGHFQNSRLENLTEEEKKVLEVVGREAMHIDAIIEKTNLSPATINSALTTLEMKEMIKHIGNNIYSKNF